MVTNVVAVPVPAGVLMHVSVGGVSEPVPISGAMSSGATVAEVKTVASGPVEIG